MACLVCSHPNVEAINVAIGSESIRTVSKRFNVSLSAVNRHKKHAGDAGRADGDPSDPIRDPAGDPTASKGSAAQASGPRSRALGPGERGTQNPGARETLTEIRGQKGRSAQENSLSRHARVREAAATVEPSERWSRIRFLYGLKGDYERGTTPAICAEVWGLPLTTVEHDASIAGGIAGIVADPEFDQRAWYRATYDAYERAVEHRDHIAALLKAAGVPTAEDRATGMTFTDWKGITAHAEALAKCHDQITKVTEQLGKASGSIRTGPAVVVSLTPETVDTGKDAISVQARRLKLAMLAALESAIGGVPRELRAGVMSKFKDRFREELQRQSNGGR